MSEAIGVIGLGLMGNALAHRLLGAGLNVIGFDLDRSRVDALQAIGGQRAGSVEEVAAACRRTFVSVLNIEQVEAVSQQLWLAREAGAVAEVAFCVATCPPDCVASLTMRAAERDLVMLDTPVSGTSRQVAEGAGLGLIAGDQQQADANADIISAVFPRSYFIGAAGDASKAKLAINLILGLHRLALAEGLVLAECFGLDLPRFLDVVRHSAAYSQVMDVKGDKMVTRDYTPQGKMAQNLKDVGIILVEATRRAQELPAARLLFSLLAESVNRGNGDLDNCAIIEEVRRRDTG